MDNMKRKTIGFIILSLVLLSLALFAIEQTIFSVVPRTNYSDHMASMVAMIILITLILTLSIKRKFDLSIFPPQFTIAYLCTSIIAGILFIATPSNFTGGLRAISLLTYSSIVTPIFEELIFRGYVWNKLNKLFINEWKTYIKIVIKHKRTS